MSVAGSHQFVEYCSCFPEVGCVEPLCEPIVNRREEVAGLGMAVLVEAQAGEAHCRAQFPKLSFLLLGDAHGFAVEFLGGFGMPLPQQQLAFVPVQLRLEPAFPCSFDDLQRIVQ